MTAVSIILPVGNPDIYGKYLPECVQSIVEQMEEEDELIVVGDGFEPAVVFPFLINQNKVYTLGIPITIGCALAWNYGTAWADPESDLYLLMGSDDKLLPGALSSLKERFIKNRKKEGWYNLTCITSTEEVIGAHNNAGAVTPHFWEEEFGMFPLEAVLGAPDALMISIMMVHYPEYLHQVGGEPTYWVREHTEQDTFKKAKRWYGPVIEIRDEMTRNWKKWKS